LAPAAMQTEVADFLALDSPLLMIAAVVIGVLAAVAIAMLHRQRRRMDALMERLETLEKLRAQDQGIDPTGGSAPVGSGSAPGQPAAEQKPQPAGDVLAGLTSYVREVVAGGDDSAVSLADQSVSRVHARLEDNITPHHLASELRVSLRTLERVLSATLECTPRQLITAMKMREARRLLESGDYRVSEVAYHLGFTSPAHFSTRFKAFYRKPPSALLKRSREG